ncbi:zygote arrest protein 1 [Sebastes umbrosus]|uniref:zygote arrest protein 1 n=1 Tax=Sebastes umbrosus TaxID=72105 RepID=UPI00189E2F20|nr:zygote arrest protein 1 [Sebastes umbrosus]
MASYADEPVDSYFYSSSYNNNNNNPYLGRYQPRAKEWRYKSYLSHYGDSSSSEAFNNQQRAQLKSILSQINPKLTPRLRRANTRDVAVQVNPRRDAEVQCSIGTRTLLAWKRDARRRRKQDSSNISNISSSRAAGGAAVRYPRTLAVYSPIAYRSVTSFITSTCPLVDENNNDNNSSSQEASCGEAHTGDPPGDPPEKSADIQAGEDGKSAKLPDKRNMPKTKQQVEKSEDALMTSEGSKGKARVRFQFLEQKYGYYHCRECNLRWESAYVWCVQGTSKVYFKQYCRKCQKDFNPYRVEDITCHTCNKARCSCAITQRHVDPKRPHRQDLCGRCKGKRLSCESTFSFKYII